MNRRNLALALLLVASTASSNCTSAEWSQFRGPNASGIATATNVPSSWAPNTNIIWRTPLPSGHSSPCIWRDRIFLTAFEKAATAPSPTEAQTLRQRLLSGAPQAGELFTLCLSRSAGRILWKKKCPVSRVEDVHVTSSPASSTAATDGERVCVFFGSFGLLCYDVNGAELWRHPMGPFRNGWGASGSSPVIVGDAVVINVNNDDTAFLLALNKRNGRVLWQTSRTPQRSYATPMVWENGGKKQIVINGTEYLIAYDPDTGKEIWRCGGQTKYVNPTPVSGAGLLFTACNGPGGSVVMAIKPDGQGDITESHIAWQRMGTAPYVSSPLLVGQHLYVIRNGGHVTCYEATSGKMVWQSRLPSTGNFYSSPIYADGKVFAVNEAGVFSVFAASPEFRLISTVNTGERTYATPAVIENRLYVRTEAAFYCIGAP